MAKFFYKAKNPNKQLKYIFELYNKTLYAEIKNKTIISTMNKIYGIDSWFPLKVLDAGSGVGFWTNFFISKGADVTYVDTCEQNLKSNAKLNPQAKFILTMLQK